MADLPWQHDNGEPGTLPAGCDTTVNDRPLRHQQDRPLLHISWLHPVVFAHIVGGCGANSQRSITSASLVPAANIPWAALPHLTYR